MYVHSGKLNLISIIALQMPLTVPLCLHWFSRLDALDIEFMKKLHDRVNIVPVLAKADSLTKTELKTFKAQVILKLL